MTSKEIRRQFIEYFQSKDHKKVKSAPVIPINDPTLLFINAGMNQFKEIFLGHKKTTHPRLVNSQKCIRAGGKHNDLDEVGKDVLHHTFFEMLGNWSFGDYYKKEAIVWAWELLTDVWRLDKDRLYATVHHADKESFSLWQTETDINVDHLEYHGDKDNFWEMGDTGPCGPCSEIHIDLGAEQCSKQNVAGHQCKVNGNCNRFIELWNLVFIQYNKDEQGRLNSLDKHFVDTGAGFERLCMVLQGKNSNYDTDLFLPLIDKLKNIVKDNGKETKIKSKDQSDYLANEGADPYLVISDHIRTLCVAIADGGYPSNEGRGYVLRRILRRAARYGRLLGLTEPFLHHLISTVSKTLAETYPEIKEKEAYIRLIVKSEEDRFNQTLDKGLVKFSEIIDRTKDGVIEGKDVFLLYDTFGFPPDLTSLLAKEKNLHIDESGFNKEMDKQKQLARNSSSFQRVDSDHEDWTEIRSGVKTDFVGYDSYQTTCHILKYQSSTTPGQENIVKLTLDKTPFYAESGGQVADKGYLINEEVKIEICDVKKERDDIIHYGKIINGELNDQPLTSIIDSEYRRSVERNHTSTHLLHNTLRQVLGEHVQQKGSLVTAEYFRFDYSHFNALTSREIDIIEDEVNKKIKEAVSLDIAYTSYENAKDRGAIALFGEKYGDKVRVVNIGDCSLELCGGTHVSNTGEIGLFKIISDTAISSGIRRIESVTGTFAENYVRKIQRSFQETAILLNVPLKDVPDKVSKVLSELSEVTKELQRMKLKSAGDQLDAILSQKNYVGDIAVVSGQISVSDNSSLRNLGDILRQKISSGIGVLGAVIDGKVALITIVTEDLVSRIQAGKIVSQVASLVDGKGGGRKDMAMAGGKNPEKLPQALNEVKNIIIQLMK